MKISALESKVAQIEARLAARKPWPCLVMCPPHRALKELFADGVRYERLAGESPEEFLTRVQAENPPSFRGVTVINFSPPTGGM